MSENNAIYTLADSESWLISINIYECISSLVT